MNDAEPPALEGRTVTVGRQVGKVLPGEVYPHRFVVEMPDRTRDHLYRDEFFVLPTREQIAEALHDHDHMHTWRSSNCDDACGLAAFQRADIVIALLSTTSTKGDNKP